MAFCPGDSSVTRRGRRLGADHRMLRDAEHLLQADFNARHLTVIVDRHLAVQGRGEMGGHQAVQLGLLLPGQQGFQRLGQVQRLQVGLGAELASDRAAASRHRPAGRRRSPRASRHRGPARSGPAGAGQRAIQGRPIRRRPSSAARAIASGGASQGGRPAPARQNIPDGAPGRAPRAATSHRPRAK